MKTGPKLAFVKNASVSCFFRGLPRNIDEYSLNIVDTGMGPLLVKHPKIASGLGHISMARAGSSRGMPI